MPRISSQAEIEGRLLNPREALQAKIVEMDWSGSGVVWGSIEIYFQRGKIYKITYKTREKLDDSADANGMEEP